MNAALCCGSEHGFVAGLKIGSSLPDREGKVIRRCRPAMLVFAAVLYAKCCGGAKVIQRMMEQSDAYMGSAAANYGGALHRPTDSYATLS